jgi:hypothetical protein
MLVRRILGGTMFLVVCSAVAALACSDIDRPLDPRGPKPIAEVQKGPTVLLSLTCEMNSSSAKVSCKSPVTAAPPGVNASVIYGATATYAIFFPYNLVKDTVAHTWQFTAYLQNLLKQSIGTLNGTTTTGVKVFVTDFHATTGTGAVSVANADGTGTFTAPNQPYFNYNQIIASSAYSGNKLWKFNVPNSVTAVSMSILISTDFPAEQNVAIQPPTNLPGWFYNDSSWTNGGAGARAFLKRTLSVLFRVGTTLADRQLAIAYIGGTVVGGVPMPDGDGFYVVTVPDDGTGTQLNAAVTRIKSLPQVEGATIQHRVKPAYLRPNDGGGWSQWSLNPDSVSAGGTWALEAIDAPFAWGCSTGDTSVKIGVIDEGFQITEVSGNVVSGTDAYSAMSISPHGSWVTSILAAPGNNQRGMTGAMWHAGLYLSSWATAADSGRFWSVPMRVAQLIRTQAAQGVRVINLSVERGDWDFPITGFDSTQSENDYTQIIKPQLQRITTLPFFVIAAGNSRVSAQHAMFPLIRRDYPANAIVVGASKRDGTAFAAAANSGSNWGPLVDIYAPGVDMSALQLINGKDSVINVGAGTSFSAPLVTAAAGLLLSFDPRLSVTDLRDLIIKGSQDAGRTVHDQGGTNLPRLNLYYALKRAAKRPGAPLCGNRVWSVNGQVIAMRDSAINETLFSTGESGGYMTVMHGGHRIHFLGDSSFNDREFVFDGTHWNEAGNPDTLPPAVPGGSAYSELQASHDGDSAVIVQAFQNGAAEQVNVSLEAVSTRLTKPLSSWSVPLSDNSSHFCRSQGARFETDTLPPFATHFRGYVCDDSTGVSGSFETANAQAAYSPLGDRVIVTINRSITQSTGVQDWQTCPGSTADPYTGVPLRQCRSASYQQTDEAALVYAVRTADGARSQLTNVAAGDVFWRAVSEPGTELVLGIGAVTSTWDIVPYYFYNQATGGSSLTFIDSNSTRLVSNCRLEYRTLATGTVNSTTPTNDPCTADGLEGSGTFSPRRVANSGAN